jgi:GntR family transcriptional regulator, transcriptional repressor for pyruvate dehydrogenase complex
VTIPTGEVQRLARAIAERIVSGTYPAGLRLPSETELASEFRCGRSTVREALRHLADVGIVRSKRGSGAMVLDFKREGTPALLPAFLMAGQFDLSPAVMACELLRLRTLMACEAVRLAARHAKAGTLEEARARLAQAPALEHDPSLHASNELELYRALVVASGIWPAVWLVNSFWGPLGEVLRTLAPAMGPVLPGFQPTMTKLFGLIERRREEPAVALAQRWFAEVDAKLIAVIEQAMSLAAALPRPGPSPNGSDEPTAPQVTRAR